ncbi:MAG: hypothetical protein IKO39_06845 [Treponema sp.]|nr:hypothetical protein [Treponema sp.]
MKKVFLALMLLAFCPLVFAHVGLGGSFTYNASTSPSCAASFTARSDESPWGIFMNAHLKENTVSIFADNWFVNERLAEHLDYFVLWGISLGTCFEKKSYDFGTGCRFGAGLDFFFFKRHLEFFAQAVWNPYFGVKKEDGKWSPLIRPVNFPCTAGLRLWF